MNNLLKKFLTNITIQTIRSKEFSMSKLTTLKHNFFQALTWNTIEAIVYQTVFFIHQSYFFYLIPNVIYGASNTIISTAFTFIVITTFSLDTTLMIWIKEFTQNKDTYKRCFYRYILPQIIFYSLTPFLLRVIFECLKHTSLSNNNVFILLNEHWLLFGFFIAIEGTRKLLRHLSQFIFLNKQTSLFELSHLLGYCFIIWILYLKDLTINITQILTSFIIMSSLITLFFIKILYDYYKKLSESEKRLPLPSLYETQKIRLWLFINQIIRIFFSSNILIPLGASIFGFSQISYATYINYVLYTITFFIYRICIPSAAALFSHIDKDQDNLKRRIFLLSLKTMFFLIFIVTLLILIFIGYGYFSQLLNYEATMCLLILGTSHIIETSYTLYEKYFIIEKKIKLLTCHNIIHISIGLFLFLKSYNIFYIIMVCSFLRLIMIIFFYYTFFQKQKVSS